MKEKLEALQGMVKNEILKGNFKVETSDKYTIYIKVDSLYFSLWVANGIPFLRSYESEYNDIHLYFNEDEKLKVWNILFPTI